MGTRSRNRYGHSLLKVLEVFPCGAQRVVELPPPEFEVSPRAGKSQCICLCKKAVKLILYYTTPKHTCFIRKDSKYTPWPECPYASRLFAVWDKLRFSDKPLKQFKPLPHVLLKIQPWLSCGFLKYASNYCHAWGAGKPSVWMARFQPKSGRHAVPGVGVLSEPCVDYWEIVKIILKKSKVPPLQRNLALWFWLEHHFFL